jgi:methylated-DNA-[protein]-cysteine S-methyltransferase
VGRSPAGRPFAYAELATPLGLLFAVASGDGIRWLGFEEEATDAELARVVPGPLRPAPRRFDRLRSELDGYFAGRRRAFATPVDLSPIHGFPLRVLQAVRRIPYGAVATYGEVAAMAGSPRAWRAAGSALAACPVELLVPCHRVIPAGGGIGGYGGHEDRKASLLAHEGTAPDADPHRAGRWPGDILGP